MLGVAYIILSFILGYVVCSYLLPDLSKITEKTYRGNKLKLNSLFILVPSWYVVGTLIITWMIYITAYIFRDTENPLLTANVLIMILVCIFCILGIYLLYKKDRIRLRGSFKNFDTIELVLFILIALLTFSLMIITLIIYDDKLHVGITVFSDFSPHLSMIRSFSHGSNFPTQYTFFAGEDVRYHFMYQFLVGNLEFLGLRLDMAFNIPSMFSLFFTFSMLYVLAVKITGSKKIGTLSCLFFAFRSSSSLFKYLAGIPEKSGVLKTALNNTDFIGSTPNENWGLWNLNVYCNQRHLAFSLVVMLLIIILFLPQVYEMSDRIRMIINEKKRTNNRKINKLFVYLKNSIFNKEGWRPHNISTAVVSGVILGGIGFWNGAVLIGTLAVLFVLAVFADRRLEYLIMAVIAGGLSFLQTKVFISDSVVEPKLFFGFIAENKTVFGVLEYIINLMGILPFIIIIIFAISKIARRCILIAFTAPMIIAFTVSLTVDVTVNHKYIMISSMLLGIFAAILVNKLYSNKNMAIKIICVIMVLLMTGTGIYDYYTIIRKNLNEYLTYDLNDNLTKWIDNNTDSSDIFLTSNYHMGNTGSGGSVILSGAMLYQGWQYFGWSAGYDTDGRDLIIKQIYEARSEKKLKYYVKKAGIDYIVIDDTNRESNDYQLNEAMIDSTYLKVYEKGTGDMMVSIYDTSELLFE